MSLKTAAWAKRRRFCSAGHWYEQSLPKLEGVSKTKVEKRLAEIPMSAPSFGSQRLPPLAISPFNENVAKMHQARWAKYLRMPVVQANSIGMKLALIPPGEFDMGSPKELIEEEVAAARKRRMV